MRPRISESAYARLVRLLDFTLGLSGLITLGLLILVIGFPLPTDLRDAVSSSTRGILAIFVIQELLRFGLSPRPFTLLRSRRVEAFIAIAAGLELVFGHVLVAWVERLAPGLSPSTITLLYLGGTQLTLLASIALRAIRDNRWLNGSALSPGLVLILGFTGLITLGTLLLQLPHATHQGISWTDSLFLATSAVCVTGLTPVDISSTLTLHGQWILLGLFQTGGLGIMTLTYFFAYYLAGGVSLRNRIGLQDLLSEENLGHIGVILALIVAFTLGIELVGAALIYNSLVNTASPPDNLHFFALFHSVSAFCNAGFSTLPTGLADPRVSGQMDFLSTIMVLIVLGGLGFPVVKNFRDFAAAWVRRRLGLRVATPPRLTANSRVVLITTAVLLIGGTVIIWITEFAFGRGEAEIAAKSTWFTALFHSVTARSGGFNITPTEALLPGSAAFILFLMFVGGSPSSTAGGIKTSTLAVAILSLRRIVLGRRDIEAFGRRLPEDLSDRALSIVMLTIGFITAISITLCTLHPEMPPEDLVFEAVSAVCTVGLSRNLTWQLDDPAKYVLAFGMLVGRVGVLVFITSFIPRRPTSVLRYPETQIVLS